MLVDDLRTELARAAEQVPAGALEPQEVLTRMVRRVRRRLARRCGDRSDRCDGCRRRRPQSFDE